jgi:hypothetical protein
MRPPHSSGTTTLTQPTTDEQRFVPRGEQDEDRWRYAMPGRDPVIQRPHALQDYMKQVKDFEEQNKHRLWRPMYAKEYGGEYDL